MYVSGKVILVETTPGMWAKGTIKENDGGRKLK
jgi:hypothetical protein